MLSHFAEDVVFTSPVAARVLPESAGVLRGKPALREYWGVALSRIPDLRFELLDVFAGIDTIVIGYRNHTGARVCEVLIFDGPLVVAGHGNYQTDDAATTSGVQPHA